MSSLQAKCVEAFADQCCSGLDEVCLVGFAKRVASNAIEKTNAFGSATRFRDGPNRKTYWCGPRVAELVHVDLDYDEKRGKTRCLGVYHSVLNWEQVASAIVEDDQPWASKVFCAKVGHYFQSLNWPTENKYFERLERVAPKFFEGRWLLWHRLCKEEHRQGSEFLREIARSSPTLVLDALEASEGDLDCFFVGFRDEPWRRNMNDTFDFENP